MFADALALSRLDEESGQGEERWVTIGRIPTSKILLVVHTYIEISADRTAIRIIAARRPTRREVSHYEEG
ncbi:BrnT family toxin [Bradyrhizobium lablabi]|uniref:BrnT family toxin n=1 Tax=Bradyrhizobium lablabi TaxID=722472 RepID=UPI001BA81508|nr:BrnT family toxin [Bradyrhizobium lablabi]